MAEKFSGVIARARDLLGDATGLERYATSTLMRFANDAISAIAIAKPQLFVRLVAFDCDSATGVVQAVPSSWISMVDVIGVVDGGAVRKADRAMLDRVSPNWMRATPGVPAQWSAVAGDDRHFLLSPPPAAGAQLQVLAAISDQTYVLSDPLPVPDAYAQAVAFFVAAQAFGTEDEDMNDAKSQKFMGFFFNFIGADDAAQQKIRAQQAERRSGVPE